MMDRTIVLVNLILAVAFLAAGVIVLIASDFTVGIGLCGVAAGLAYGTASSQ